MREPRGPRRDVRARSSSRRPATDADWGVLFIEVSGCLPMCGHGTIGVATVLVETGMVAVTEPETVIRLDTPAGLVEARVRRERRPRATAVTLRNVPAVPRSGATASSRVHGTGTLAYDMAFGGNFYAIVDAATLGLEVDPARAPELVDAGARVMAAINATDRPVHPEDERIAGCRHVVFTAPGHDGADARAATSIHPGWLDRSPCGTGTCARMAQLHARGELALSDRLRATSRYRDALHRPAGRRDRGRRAARR